MAKKAFISFDYDHWFPMAMAVEWQLPKKPFFDSLYFKEDSMGFS